MDEDRPDLRDAEQCLQALLNQVPDLIFFKDIDSRFTRVNHAYAASVGCADPSAIVGKTDADFFPAEAARAYLADEHHVLTSGEASIGKQESFTDAQGLTRWVLTNKVPVRDGDGRIIGLVGISREITDHTKTVDALQSSEALLNQAQRLGQIGAWDWHLASNANPARPGLLDPST